MTTTTNLAQIARADATIFELLGKLAGRAAFAANHTFALAERGWMVESTSGSLVTLTIPTNATVAFPVNTLIHIHRYGAGDVAIAPASGVTLLSSSSNRKLAAQYTTACLWQRAVDEWILTGALKA